MLLEDLLVFLAYGKNKHQNNVESFSLESKLNLDTSENGGQVFKLEIKIIS